MGWMNAMIAGVPACVTARVGGARQQPFYVARGEKARRGRYVDKCRVQAANAAAAHALSASSCRPSTKQHARSAFSCGQTLRWGGGGKFHPRPAARVIRCPPVVFMRTTCPHTTFGGQRRRTLAEVLETA